MSTACEAFYDTHPEPGELTHTLILRCSIHGELLRLRGVTPLSVHIRSGVCASLYDAWSRHVARVAAPKEPEEFPVHLL